MDQLDKVDYQLNALKMNILMEQTFVNNMLLMKEWQPRLYVQLRQCNPEKMKLRFGNDKILNLYDVEHNVPLYNGDPNTVAKDQVKDFLDNVIPLTLRAEGNVVKEGIYSECAEKVYAAKRKLGGRDYRLSEGEIPFVLMLGGGLGLQLEHLLNARDVKRMVYFEPNIEALHASMHVVDWGQIKQYFDRDGYEFVFRVGVDHDQFYSFLTSYARLIGAFNLLYCSVYAHYDSPETYALAERIKKDFSKLFYGLGYYDDERVGLAHTVANCIKNIPVAREGKDRGLLGKSAAVVIGNGPSLNNCFEFIERNRENLVVISCGSALGTLFAHDLKPDIHLEQERVALVYDVVEECSNAEFRQGVRFVGLNPVHQDAFDLFDADKLGFWLKPNDVGADLISEYLEPDTDFHIAYHCNPTVTNMGVALSAMLGFGKVYLAGIDCGFVDPENHHASNGWYDKNLGDKTQKKLSDDFLKQGTIVRKGNFRPEVLTTLALDGTRVGIESIIRDNLDNITFYNLNDGVFFEGASPTQPQDAEAVESNGDKDQLLDAVFSSVFVPLNDKGANVRSVVESDMKLAPEIINDLKNIYRTPIDNREGISRNLNLAHKYIVHLYKKHRLFYHILGGSIESCNVLINMGCYSRNREEMCIYYHAVSEALCEFLDKAEIEIREDPCGEQAPEKGTEVLDEFRSEDD